MQPVLLDTCAVIWMVEEAQLSQPAVKLLQAAAEGAGRTYISPITAWEWGLLGSGGRMQITAAPDRWFARLFEVPGVLLADMPPEVLIASSFLPGVPPRDPADRIIAATARDLGATLVTRDRALLAYGGQGHLNVVAC